jgi:hypothetical protein
MRARAGNWPSISRHQTNNKTLDARLRGHDEQTSGG